MQKDQPLPPLRVSEVAHRLNMSPHSVRVLIRRGHLPAFRIGPHWRIWQTALDAALRAGELEAGRGEAA